MTGQENPSGHPGDEAGPVGVAGAGGVDDGGRAGGGDLVFLALDGDQGPGLALGDDGDRHPLAELVLGDPELLGHHAELVVVAGEDLRPLEPGLQLDGRHPGGLHRGVVEVGDAQRVHSSAWPAIAAGSLGAIRTRSSLVSPSVLEREARGVLHGPG